MPVLPEFLNCLRRTGFRVIEADDISWRVALSVAQVPWVTLCFLISEFAAKRRQLSPERWNNLLAPLLTSVVGLARAHFGYYIIRAAKV
jgi:hypothetical protein